MGQFSELIVIMQNLFNSSIVLHSQKINSYFIEYLNRKGLLVHCDRLFKHHLRVLLPARFNSSVLCSAICTMSTMNTHNLHQTNDATPAYCQEKPEMNEIESANPHEERVSTSKRALKRKKKTESKQTNVVVKRTKTSDTSGFTSDMFLDTDYYFENGLRKVYTYYFSFTTYAKGRWFGRTLLDVYTTEFRGDAEDHQTSVEVGNISVNGNVVPCDYIIKNQDFLSHTIHRHENPVCDRPIELLHVDDDMVVIDKPSSIPCHPCGKYRYNSILFILGKQLGLEQLRNIYRLDRLTSGVLIMGRGDHRTKQLESEVANRLVEKEYICRVVGDFPPGVTTVDQPLGCICHKLSLYRVDPQGKPSCTVFEKVHYNGRSSVVKCRPQTGRTHQIRVHLQYLGHPIVNDPLYNTEAWGPNRCKGGVLDKTLQELQDAIRAEHHVGRYVDAEDSVHTLAQPPHGDRLGCGVAAAGKATVEVDTTAQCPNNAHIVSDTVKTIALPIHCSGDNVNMSQTVKSNTQAKHCYSDTVNIVSDTVETITHPAHCNSDTVNIVSDTVETITHPAHCNSDTVNIVSDTVETITHPAHCNSDTVNIVSDAVETITHPAHCNIDTVNVVSDTVETITRPAHCNSDTVNIVSEKVETIAEPAHCGSDSVNFMSHSSDRALNTVGTIFTRSNEVVKYLNSQSGYISHTVQSNRGNLTFFKMADKTTEPLDAKRTRLTTCDRAGAVVGGWDKDCHMCRRRYISPSPEDLVMYLHALRYKGPGWEFSTDVPEWGKPEWSAD